MSGKSGAEVRSQPEVANSQAAPLAMASEFEPYGGPGRTRTCNQAVMSRRL